MRDELNAVCRLEVPLAALGTAWTRDIVVPVQTALNFDAALEQFHVIVNELFEGGASGTRVLPHEAPGAADGGRVREASRSTHLRRRPECVAVCADHQEAPGRARRGVLVCVRPDRWTGVGPRHLVHGEPQDTDVAVLDDKFEPRYPIELGRAGEFGGRGYFTGAPGRR